MQSRKSSVVEDSLRIMFEFFSERIPRGLPRGKRANQDKSSTLGIGDSPELAPVSLQYHLLTVSASGCECRGIQANARAFLITGPEKSSDLDQIDFG
jgi:hypothetical protein